MSEVIHRGLPPELAERITVQRDGPIPQGREFVLYWMRAALRAHENPALDVALLAARALGLPVFVYHALAERYPFASDRHHTFILEGARDVAAECASRGVGYAFHLERPGHRGPHLRTLAARAALVLTDEMPVAPHVAWLDALLRRTDAPLWTVDASCIVPLPLVSGAFDRAYAFRNATAPLRAARVGRIWRDVEPHTPPFVPSLPFTPVDLAHADLAALVARCEIDHGIAPVPDTPGGAVAGYERWDAFVRSGRLQRYDRGRGDPLRPGTSRMSPYLRYGMVSPFRLAREAEQARLDGAPDRAGGPEKFLDELLVWRELAWAFCYHRPDHDLAGALPDWARETLGRHARDARTRLSWETLARARTGDVVWDAMQTSLVVHGELHNDARMTWGKAIPQWTGDVRQALATLIDLNHRYALDGRDPSSYGGILWCLGLFDRPFSPEVAVMGEVRHHTTSEHARRLDVGRYARLVRRAPVKRPPTVAVIGGGMAGLAAARALADHRLPVTVFDKARAPGGRISTRRTTQRDGTIAFDHGAPCFTARDPRFARHVASWAHDGLVARWQPRLGTLRDAAFTPDVAPAEARWVGVPGMSAVARHLAADLEVRAATRVERLVPDGAGWRLEGADGEDLGGFERVIVALPAPQAAALIDDASPELAAFAAATPVHPCWAVMLALESPIEVPFDAAHVEDGLLSWVARESSKPGRAAGERWVLHATPAWSATHLEEDPSRVADAIATRFARLAGVAELPRTSVAGAHRWRHALARPSVDGAALVDGGGTLVACGDWCVDGRVEGAWLSGVAAAGRVLGKLAWASSRGAARGSARWRQARDVEEEGDARAGGGSARA